jgi:hypothetical protein
MMRFIVDNDMRCSQRNETPGADVASLRGSLQLSAPRPERRLDSKPSCGLRQS